MLGWEVMTPARASWKFRRPACFRVLFKRGQARECDVRFLKKFFFLLDLSISAGAEVVFVCHHLLLFDPELAPELVDLRLQWGDTGLKFSEFGLGFLAGFAGLVGSSSNDFLELEAVNDGVMFEAVWL